MMDGPSVLLEDHSPNSDEPKSLKQLVDWLKNTNENALSNQNDVLTLLLYILMLEVGFVPKSYSTEVADCNFAYSTILMLSESLPGNWKLKDYYQLEFVLGGTDENCTITGIVVGEDYLVNCVIEEVTTTFTLMLDPMLYCLAPSASRTQMHGLNLQNLKGLSRTFKDAIANPAKNTIVKSVLDGFCVCLEHLPEEILLVLIKYLNVKDLTRLSATCTFFNHLCDDPKWWIRRVKLDFNKDISVSPLVLSAKKFYKQECLRFAVQKW